jgi:voltage-gated potassium channel
MSLNSIPGPPRDGEEQAERWRVLAHLEDWLEKPMLFLGAVWFCLVLVELIWTTSSVFEFIGTAIWLIFLAEFALRLSLAPDKLRFLRGNLITVIALIAPAFRFLRVFRLLRVARGVRLVRIVGTANRGIMVLRKSFTRRGLGYVVGATALLILLGAAGMLAFEPAREVDGGFASYADALWWTAMLISTMGSGYWPQTAEGRLLTLFLSLYGLAIFGYITASFASFLIGQDARAEDGEVAGSGDLVALRNEITLLRVEVQRLAGRAMNQDSSIAP